VTINHADIGSVNCLGAVHYVPQQRLPGKTLQYLWQRGTHTPPLTRRENDNANVQCKSFQPVMRMIQDASLKPLRRVMVT